MGVSGWVLLDIIWCMDWCPVESKKSGHGLHIASCGLLVLIWMMRWVNFHKYSSLFTKISYFRRGVWLDFRIYPGMQECQIFYFVKWCSGFWCHCLCDGGLNWRYEG